MKNYYSISQVAEMLGKNPETLGRWGSSGKLPAVREPMSNYRVDRKEQLQVFPEFKNAEKNNPEVNWPICMIHWKVW